MTLPRPRTRRYARGLAEQDKDPQDHYDKRGVTRMYGVGGANGRIVIDGPDDELDRIMNTFDAYLDWLRSRNAGGSGGTLSRIPGIHLRTRRRLIRRIRHCGPRSSSAATTPFWT